MTLAGSSVLGVFYPENYFRVHSPHSRLWRLFSQALTYWTSAMLNMHASGAVSEQQACSHSMLKVAISTVLKAEQFDCIWSILHSEHNIVSSLYKIKLSITQHHLVVNVLSRAANDIVNRKQKFLLVTTIQRITIVAGSASCYTIKIRPAWKSLSSFQLYLDLKGVVLMFINIAV